MYFGEQAREHQAEILDSNLEFRERMRILKQAYAEERMDAQKCFRRESYELGRQYLIQQTIAQNASRQKQIEFKDFITRYWPLNETVYSVLMRHKQFLEKKSIIPLTVYVARTELTAPMRNSNKYKEFCELLIDSMKGTGVTVEDCPWKSSCQSRIGEAMNVNYIMGGIPSLIIFPYQQSDTIGIEAVSWSFAKGLQGMNHTKALQIKCPSNDLIPEYTLAAVRATIGMTRDAYMLAEYHAPVLFGNKLDTQLLSIPEIREQLLLHYSDMKQLTSSTEFSQLCTQQELDSINSSLNINLLNS
jgi:hypothetical protein